VWSDHVRCTVILLSDQSNKVQLLLTEFYSTFHEFNYLFLYLNCSVGVWGSSLFSLTLSGKNSAVTYSGSGVHSQGFGAPAVRKTQTDRGPGSSSSTLPSAVNPSCRTVQFGSETEQLEWAKRESQREEAERIRRLRLQEQLDLELALALSRAEMPRT
ncbi:epidermal growth factor receptor substrate 15-like 1, partial [Sinocyclocheilus rhinocerous]|uniref:epidermal growth factor receptor substrate 15-like 1 n=1 Tax=Sinocyclocheilus rhinocerous TaxID=307959 RepID=UPI0007B7B064